MPDPRPPKKEVSTFATFETVQIISPGILGYVKGEISNPIEQKNYVKQCLELANEWINNQLEAAEVDTFAKSNEKRLAEANYAAYLILRGVVRGERAEQNSWVKSYKDDAEKLIKDIKDKQAAVPGHSSRTERFSKKRWMHKLAQKTKLSDV